MKLEFEPEELPPLDELEAIATITEADITAAADAWKADPPAEEFTHVLEATEEES